MHQISCIHKNQVYIKSVAFWKTNLQQKRKNRASGPGGTNHGAQKRPKNIVAKDHNHLLLISFLLRLPLIFPPAVVYHLRPARLHSSPLPSASGPAASTFRTPRTVRHCVAAAAAGRHGHYSHGRGRLLPVILGRLCGRQGVADVPLYRPTLPLLPPEARAGRHPGAGLRH